MLALPALYILSISLPAGWTSKTIPRKSGKSAGSKDTYYYSAEKEIKFRSAKECNKFIQILEQPGINGETEALEVFKERYQTRKNTQQNIPNFETMAQTTDEATAQLTKTILSQRQPKDHLVLHQTQIMTVKT